MENGKRPRKNEDLLLTEHRYAFQKETKMRIPLKAPAFSSLIRGRDVLRLLSNGISVVKCLSLPGNADKTFVHDHRQQLGSEAKMSCYVSSILR